MYSDLFTMIIYKAGDWASSTLCIMCHWLENKNMHHIAAVSQVYSVSYWDSSLGVSFSQLWGTVLKRYQYICDFYEGVPAASRNILVEGCCWSQGTDVLVNGFSAFLRMGRCKNWGSWHFLLKTSNSVRALSDSFPSAHSASWRSPPCTPLRGCCRSGFAVAQDSVLVELDVKWHSLAGKTWKKVVCQPTLCYNLKENNEDWLVS